jgi:hypothetical protein
MPMAESPNSLLPPGRDLPGRPPLDDRAAATILWQVLTARERTLALTPPEVPEDLTEMPLLLRLHACLRLFLLDMEYALSPGGQLRGIVKLVCRVSFVLGFLALCLAGVSACAVLVLAIALVITRELVAILWNLLTAMLLLVALLAIAGVLLLAARFLTSQSRNR